MEALQLHANTQSHWSRGQTLVSRLGGSGSRPGDASTITMEPGSLLAKSCYKLFEIAQQILNINFNCSLKVRLTSKDKR